MLEGLISNPMLALAICAIALVVAGAVLFVVYRDVLPRLAKCEGLIGGQAPTTPTDASPEDKAEKPTVPTAGPSAAAAVSTRSRKPGSASQRVSESNPHPRRQGGVMMPGKSTRRSRVQVSEFTPESVSKGMPDDTAGARPHSRARLPPQMPGAGGAPEKVTVRRVEKASAATPASHDAQPAEQEAEEE